MSRSQLELHIDFARCDGRGLCTELLPELLVRDDWGYPVGRGGRDVHVPERLSDAAQDAVDLCPLQALMLRRVTRA
ncbi:MAG TPA: ferredoxin [Sinomonas sp.]|nr:ferredoxin [Sinomonas sp.]